MRVNWFKISGVVLTLVILASTSTNISAQTAATSAARVTQAIVEGNRVTLKGNTHPLASVKNDQGAAPDSLPMERMLLVLKRGADQESSLKTFMEGQQSKSSPNFHQWLTPEQFGQQYGVSDNDIQTVTAWLQTHGFQVNRVAAGKMLIEFTGTAGQVHEAFQTQIHKYAVNGEEHWANASDPSIPAALAPVVAGVNTLHNFSKKPMSKKLGLFQRANDTGKVSPLFSFAGCSTVAGAAQPCNALGPTDFATIYNVLPLWNAGIDGTGQTIAIVGDSEICTGATLPAGCTSDDVKVFRTLFGLPTGGANNAPQIILDGPDPGLNNDETEGDLDVEWSGAVAKNASILFVIAENTETSAGIDLAAEHIIDNNLAPVMSESFGECEPFLGNAGNLFYASLWEQAAAQGITVIISTGDSGSAACDDQNFEQAAQNGPFVNGIASTPFDVALGGTDFNLAAANYQSTFWNPPPTPLAPPDVSAKSYIPETVWNDSCAQNGLTGCNNFTTTSASINIVAGGGGASSCINSTTTQCLNGYSKPAFQTGPGVPQDSVRDIPDMALFASDGLVSGSFYIVCEADQDPALGSCNLGSPFTTFIGVGGTSSAAPAFAGIMAMVNQKMVSLSQSGRQGNANYVLYPLAAAQSPANCSSSNGPGTNSGPAANCVFNDVTLGNNSVPCIGGTQGCSNTNSRSAALGIEETLNPNTGAITGTIAYSAGAGFDLATGLGSVNANNLVNAWSAAVFAPTSTNLAVTSPASSTCPIGTAAGTLCYQLTHGSSVTVSIGVTGGVPANTTAMPEDVALLGTCVPSTTNCFNGNNTAGVNHFLFPSSSSTPTNVGTIHLTGSPTVASTSFLLGGTYNLTAHYTGDGIHGSSDSMNPIEMIVNPETSTTSLQAIDFNVISGTFSTVGTAPYGSLILLRADVVGASGQESATGTVNITDNAAALDGGAFTLNSDGYLEVQSPNVSTPGVNAPVTLIPALAVGAHSFQATYTGGPSFAASPASATVALTITKASTASFVISAPGSVVSGAPFALQAFVDTELSLAVPGSLGAAPTGTISFFSNGVMIGAPVNVTATTDSNGFVAGVATLSTATISQVVKPVGDFRGPGRIASPRVVAGMLSLALLLICTPPLRKRRRLAFVVVLFFAAGAGVVGCGSSSSSSSGSGTPASKTDNITAVYNGDSNYLSSTSSSVAITVQP
jgi:hypothetical protein